MDQKAPLIIISVSNPTAFSGKGSIIILEYIDVDAALKVARKIALDVEPQEVVLGKSEAADGRF
jgi:hypothetical protein